MTSCSSAFGLATPRLRPVRLHIAGLNQLRALRARVEGGDSLRERCGSMPAGSRLPGGRSRPSLQRVPARRNSVTRRRGRVAVEERDQRRRATEQHVPVVLPREADAAVDLDVHLGVVKERGKGLHLGNCRRERERGRRRLLPRGASQTAAVASLGSDEHVGAVGASPPGTSRSHGRTARLLLGVLRGAVDTLLRVTRGLGRYENVCDAQRGARRAAEHAARWAPPRGS